MAEVKMKVFEFDEGRRRQRVRPEHVDSFKERHPDAKEVRGTVQTRKRSVDDGSSKAGSGEK